MKHLLSSSAFLIVNKRLAKLIGLHETVLLADLISKEEYFIENSQLKDGWFFNTAKNIQEDTSLTSHQQKKCIKNLIELGLIDVKVFGIPAKQHFKIHEIKLLEYLQTSCENTVNKLLKNRKLVVKKTQTINKNKEIIINNNISIRDRFISEVNSFDFSEDLKEEFIDYWTEPSKSGRLRFEMEKTFSVSLRLKRWAKNQTKWNKGTNKGHSKLENQISEYLKGKELLK